MTWLKKRPDAHTPSGPEDVRVETLGAVAERGSYEQANGRAQRARRSSRTRWLVFLNAQGQPTVAPGVRTHQLSLFFGMGRDWYTGVMAATAKVGARSSKAAAVAAAMAAGMILGSTAEPVGER